MRLIKFRVWDKHFKQMHYPNSIWRFLVHNDGRLYYKTGCDKEENYILQQFTGLIDKNNKEIYEGDLVNFEYDTSENETELETNQEVFFEDGIFYFGRKYHFAINDCNFHSRNSLKVVGNIFIN